MIFLAALVIGMIGAFCFIIFQVVLLVDFAHRWNEWWLVVTIAMYNLVRINNWLFFSKKLCENIVFIDTQLSINFLSG